MNNGHLAELGFTEFFRQQLTADETLDCLVARVVQVQRSVLTVSDGLRTWSLPLSGTREIAAEDRPTVGDWLVVDRGSSSMTRVLDRTSLFRRVAAGTTAQIQPIAANVDILFIVTSCNDEFNESRLERYLSLAYEARVLPVMVLTKADLAADIDAYLDRARAISPGTGIEAVNALDPDSTAGVRAWIGSGQTVAFVGSSGVGKSTLVNTLLGRAATQTAAIREADARGRHTTTARSLYRLPDGGAVIDVPGMRELKVAHIEPVLDDIFDDIAALARQCRFSDCTHRHEPGCAVTAAVNAGRIQPRRLHSYRKLKREDARLSASLAQRRNEDRKLGKLYKSVLSAKNRNRHE